MQKLFSILTAFCLLYTTESCNHSSTKERSSKDSSADAEIKQSIKHLKDKLSHDVVTKKMIEMASDSTLEELIFLNIYVNIHGPTDEAYEREFHKFSGLQQAVYSTLLLERNFTDGRFYAYFDRFHYLSEEASKGYIQLGFPKLSKIVIQATSLYERMLEKNSLEFAELDSIFAQQITLDNTSSSRIHLIRSNIDSFITKQ